GAVRRDPTDLAVEKVEHVVVRLGEPEVAVRAGRNRQGATGRGGEREIGGGAVQGEPLDAVAFGEPGVAVRPGGNAAEQVAAFKVFEDRLVPGRLPPAPALVSKPMHSELDTKHQRRPFWRRNSGNLRTGSRGNRGPDMLAEDCRRTIQPRS